MPSQVKPARVFRGVFSFRQSTRHGGRPLETRWTGLLMCAGLGRGQIQFRAPDCHGNPLRRRAVRHVRGRPLTPPRARLPAALRHFGRRINWLQITCQTPAVEKTRARQLWQRVTGGRVACNCARLSSRRRRSVTGWLDAVSLRFYPR